MKTLKAIKYNNGYVFVDETDEPYPIGFHLKKNEIIEVKGIGEKSGEVFHEKGFNYKGEIVKIVAQYNLGVYEHEIPHVELDLNFLEKELRQHREQIKTAETKHHQDMILTQCSNISYLKIMYKEEIESKKYTEEDLKRAFDLGKQVGYKLDFDAWSGMKDDFISSLYPPILSIDIETIHVMPQSNGTRADDYITDEISLNPLLNTLEVPVIAYKFGKQYVRLMKINHERDTIQKS